MEHRLLTLMCLIGLKGSLQELKLYPDLSTNVHSLGLHVRRPMRVLRDIDPYDSSGYNMDYMSGAGSDDEDFVDGYLQSGGEDALLFDEESGSGSGSEDTETQSAIPSPPSDIEGSGSCEPGVPGLRGPPGESIVGPRGPPGIAGPPGPPGAIAKFNLGLELEDAENEDELLDRIRGPPGPPGECTCSITSLAAVLSTSDSLRGPEGPPGIEGAAGMPGMPGQEGPRGLRGPPGPEGTKGDRGAVGPIGPEGMQGLKGEPGRDGSPGLPGAPGPPSPYIAGSGAVFTPDFDEDSEMSFGSGFGGGGNGFGRPGMPGPPGPAGLDGSPGLQGSPGSEGQKGDRGAQGPEGPQGPMGLQGEIGERGFPGDDGSPGKDGRPGEPGAVGPRGERGPPGPLGPPGPAGPPGPLASGLGWDGVHHSGAGSNTGNGEGIGGVPGPAGPVGPPGPPGPPGRGLPGPPGVPGVPGLPGPPGSGGSPGSELSLFDDETFKMMKGEKGERGRRGRPGRPGTMGELGLPGWPGRRGPPGVGAKGEPGEPGVCGCRSEMSADGTSYVPVASPPGPPGQKGDQGRSNGSGRVQSSGAPEPSAAAMSIVPGAVTFPNTASMLKRSEVSPVGTLAFIIDEEALLVRVSAGWQYVSLGSVMKHQPTDEPTTTLPTARSNDILIMHSDSLIVDLEKPHLKMAALNEPYNGDKMGLRGFDYECYRQSRRANYRGTFRAVISSRSQNVDSIVRAADRGLPVVNTKGELLFESWKKIFSGSKGVFTRPPNIYSFDGNNVLKDNTWPQKLVWHGAGRHGERDVDAYCDAWHSSSPQKVGMASSLLDGLLLDQRQFSCNNRFIVLCVEVMSETKARRRRSRRHLSDRLPAGRKQKLGNVSHEYHKFYDKRQHKDLLREDEYYKLLDYDFN